MMPYNREEEVHGPHCSPQQHNIKQYSPRHYFLDTFLEHHNPWIVPDTHSDWVKTGKKNSTVHIQNSQPAFVSSDGCIIKFKDLLYSCDSMNHFYTEPRT